MLNYKEELDNYTQEVMLFLFFFSYSETAKFVRKHISFNPIIHWNHLTKPDKSFFSI